MRKKNTALRNEIEVLKGKPEEIAGYKPGPWSLAQLIDAIPVMEAIAADMEVKGINLDSLVKAFGPLQPGGDDNQGYQDAISIMKALIRHLVPLLAISLHITQEEAGAITAGQSILLGLRVIAANVEHLNDFFAGVVSEGLNLKEKFPNIPTP